VTERERPAICKEIMRVTIHEQRYISEPIETKYLKI